MNKLNDIAIMNRSAENAATVHMRDRCAPYKLNGYKVFIASSGGLEDERRAFAKEIDEYNRIEAMHRGVIFQAVGREDTLPGIGRPQSIINEKLEQCE